MELYGSCTFSVMALSRPNLFQVQCVARGIPGLAEATDGRLPVKAPSFRYPAWMMYGVCIIEKLWPAVGLCINFA